MARGRDDSANDRGRPGRGRCPWHRRARRAATATALAAGGLLATGVTTPAGASSLPAVWVGPASVTAAPTTANWSNNANWQSSSGPSGSDALSFPASGATLGVDSTNDVSALTPSGISFESPPMPTILPSSANGYFQVTGNAITLGSGGLTATESNPASPAIADLVSLPITLGAAQAWSVQGTGPNLLGNVTGTSSTSLTVNLSAASASGRTTPGGLGIGGDVEVGNLQIAGAAADTGAAAGTNGSVVMLSSAASLDGSDGSTVAVTDAGLAALGTVGPLTLTGGALQVGLPTGGSLKQPTGTLSASVNGALTLDSTSIVTAAGITSATTPGTTYPQLTVSGTATLNGAQLALLTGCSPALSPGDTLTLVTAASVNGTFDYPGSNGIPLTGGDVLEAPAPTPGCTSPVAPTWFQISYTGTAVIATVVAAPSVTSLSPSTGPTTGGTQVTLTGTGFSTTAGATAVEFGTTAATGVSCSSTTTCVAVSPPGSGSVPVTAIVGGAQSYAGAGTLFTYESPPAGGGGTGGTTTGGTGGTTTGGTGGTTTGGTGGTTTGGTGGTTTGGSGGSGGASQGTSPPTGPPTGPPPTTTPAPLPPGTPPGVYTAPVSTTVGASGSASLEDTYGNARIAVAAPAGALPAGTTLTVEPASAPSSITALIPGHQAYVTSFVVGWVAPNGSSPVASQPVTMTIHDPSIAPGDDVYELTSNGLELVGVATTAGVIVVRFTSDPAFVVAQPPHLARVGRTSAHDRIAVRLVVGCAAGATCRGSVVLRALAGRGGAVLARGVVALPAGRARIVSLPLTAAGKRLLASLGTRRTSTILTVTLSGGATSRHPLVV